MVDMNGRTVKVDDRCENTSGVNFVVKEINGDTFTSETGELFDVNEMRKHGYDFKVV